MWWRRRIGTVVRATLRAHLGASLPDYMVPSAFVVLDRLPLTPNGKLDRRALPAPDLTPCGDARPRAPHRRRSCVRCLPRFSALERVGIDDNFFALGGDSIISIRLVSRARQAGLIITPRAVFQHQIVEALAASAQLARETSSAPARHRHRRIGADADHALADGAWRPDRAFQPSDAAAPAAGRAGGSADCGPAGGA